MPPPFNRPYDYFRHDATVFMQANRPRWTALQRQNTISTIWAGSDHVKGHYNGSARHPTGPGLPAIPSPIPDLPYRVADVRVAKRDGQLPVRASVNVVPPPVGPAVPVAPVVNVPDAPGADVGSVDKLPYDFWPQLPWDNEPDLPMFPSEEAKVNAWLRAKPHRTSDDEHRWHGVRFLGAGGYGAAGLWMEVNETNNITDVMVVKDTSYPGYADWRDPKNWRNRVPREIRIHQLVEERRKVEPEMCRYLVRYLGHRLLMRQRRYRTYLEYYEAGNLYNAMSNHYDDITSQRLPEAFIWYMVKALATACLVLQTGTTADRPVKGWKPITHLDLVLGNVFLGLKKRKRDDESEETSKAKEVAGPRGKRSKPVSKEDEEEEDWSNTDWQDLPLLPVLADLGLSFYSLGEGNCPLSDNPEDYLWCSEQTRYAPEHQYQNGPPWIPLGEKTDVWGIGSIIWHLITHQLGDVGPVREDKRGEDGEYIPISSNHERNYTKHTAKNVLSGRYFPAAKEYADADELKNLIRACLSRNQDERPTLRQLLGAADKSLRKARTKEILRDWEKFELLLPDESDDFRIGDSHELGNHEVRDSEDDEDMF